jgi:hypothetical protein
MTIVVRSDARCLFATAAIEWQSKETKEHTMKTGLMPSLIRTWSPRRTRLASHQHLPMKLGCSQDRKHLSEHVQIKPSRTSPS